MAEPQFSLDGKVVLVTGGTGSFGRKFTATVLKQYQPKKLIIFSRDELKQHEMRQVFSDETPDSPVRYFIGDVRDVDRLRRAMHGVDCVIHAAALKQVPACEYNPFEAVQTNIIGAKNVIDAAIDCGVKRVLAVSTDKAVRPTSVMGASKRLAELLCQALQARAATQFVIVRFGNVLGSTGSVIPRFREQIARGGPVTVTHPDIERYFMSIPEASQLVLQAALMGKGGEIFVLDMGQSVKIADLARQMIRLSGFSEQDIRIEFSGLRPGEKLYEEVLVDDETTLPTPHPKLRVARGRMPENPGLPEEVLAWLASARGSQAEAVRARLKAWIAEYAPSK